MAESNINVTPGSGGPNIDLELVDNGNARQVVCIGDPTTSARTATVSASGGLSVDITGVGAAALGQELMVASLPVVIASDQSAVPVSISGSVQTTASSLCQTATAATGVGVTVTLPAVSGQFHYISFIQIKKYFTVANAASATPLVVTSTNLPGSLAWTFGQPAGAIGATDEDIYNPDSPLKSTVSNIATTIVCPATTGIIWRVTVLYFAAP